MPDDWHISRGWQQDPYVDECPCEKAPCGMVVGNGIDQDCPQHGLAACKTFRASHLAADCPEGGAK